MCIINSRQTGKWAFDMPNQIYSLHTSPCSLRLHDGVLRDVEQQQRRKHENTYTLQQQIDMTKQLRAREASSNSSDTPVPPSNTPSQRNFQAGTEAKDTPTPSAQEPELQQHPEQPGAEEAGDAKPAEAATQDAPSPPSDVAWLPKCLPLCTKY